ncbi:MAG: hypothetical protein KTR29_19400 [Rhodothermaceae bacterium]|nr:hypothetical protein [Rhodothermaceae bacterium]
MSLHKIALIPENPHDAIELTRLSLACEYLTELAPSNTVAEILSESVFTFRDCGQNFERIHCPSCGEDVSVEWWGNRIDEDYDGSGFRLDRYETPCCKRAHTLHNLVYVWPQGFFKTGVEIENAIGKLDKEHLQNIEAIVAVKLRVIYIHY